MATKRPRGKQIPSPAKVKWRASKAKDATNRKKTTTIHKQSAKIPSNFDLNSCTNEEFVKFYKERPLAARKLLMEHIKPEGKAQVVNIFIDKVLESIVEWGPKQELLILYVRWAKKVPNHFHSDSMSVVHCVKERGDFKTMKDVMCSRNITFYPRTEKRKGSIFGNTIKFSDYQPSTTTHKEEDDDCDDDDDVDSDEEEVEGLGDFSMASLAADLSHFESLVMKHGKVGYRRSKDAPGPSNKNRQLEDDGEEGFYLTRNLLEFHKPKSGLNRVASHTNHRHLAFALCQFLFKKKGANSWWSRSVKLTELDGRDKHKFLTILAGVCLLFPSLDPLEPIICAIREEMFSDQGIDDLKKKAIRRSRAQVEKEALDHEIARTIQTLNNHKQPFSFHGLSGSSTNYRRQKFLLVRATIFQRWLLSNRECMRQLRATVLEELGTVEGLDDEQSDSSETIPVIPPPSSNSRGNSTSVTSENSNGPKRRLRNKREPNNSNNNTTCPLLASGKSSKASSFQPFQPRISSSLPTKLPAKLKLRQLVLTAEWKQWRTEGKFRIPSQAELDSMCISGLGLENGCISFLRLAPIEFYSADLLSAYWHWRFTCLPGDRPDLSGAPSVVWIDSSAERHVDSEKVLFAIRPGDNKFDELWNAIFGSSTNTIDRLLNLVEAVAANGSHDPNRMQSPPIDGTDTRDGTEQLRIDIQCIGQARNGPDGPYRVTGMDFLKKIRADSRWKDSGVVEIVGDLSLLAWMFMDGLEFEINGVKIAPDSARNQQFAKYLRKHLGILETIFNAESITIVIGLLFPNLNGCRGHYDIGNGISIGYTKTGTLSICIINEDKSIAIQIQNIQSYLDIVNDNYQSVFGQCPSCANLPRALNQWNMCTCDHLKYKSYEIPGQAPMQVLQPMIGPSRMVSYSMFIEPIYKLRDVLMYDQLLELVYYASLQCSPIWFNHSLHALEIRHRCNEDTFQFGTHPFYDIAEEMIHTFGNWQCAIKGRFSPCGGGIQIPEVFGFGKFADRREGGISILEKVVTIFYKYTEWIDNDVYALGNNPLEEMPLSYIQQNQQIFVKAIKKVAPCQFKVFRLGIVTMILSGCGLLKVGTHLHHLVVPAGTLASMKHLLNMAGIPREYHDQAMHDIAVKLGIPYSRLIVETLLCESKPGRPRLFFELCDWLRKNGNLFHLEKSGEAKLRPHGHGSEWEDVKQVTSKELLFVDIAEIDDRLLPSLDQGEGDLEWDADLEEEGNDTEIALPQNEQAVEDATILAEPLGVIPTNDIPADFGQEGFTQETLFSTNDEMEVDHPATTVDPSPTDLFFFSQESGLADTLFTELQNLLVSDERLLSRRRSQSVHHASKESNFQFGEPFIRDPPTGTRGDSQAAGLDFGDTLYHIDDWPSDFGEWIHVLEKGSKKVHRDVVQPLGPVYNRIFDYFGERGFIFNLLITRQSLGNCQITVFDAHEDKPEFENGVGFLSFSTPFWTVLVTDDTPKVDDSTRFVRYCRGLLPQDKRKISKFMNGFGISQSSFLDLIKDDALLPETSIRTLCPKLSFFHCTPGSALAFRKGVRHGTIIPRSAVQRHLLILTQMVEYR